MAMPEYYFREGCYITELLNSADDDAVSVARARVEPGRTTRWHRLHNTGERYIILSGSGVVEIGNEAARVVQAGDTLFIPALCPQRIHNNGSDDLIFLAVCTPRFEPDNYEDIDSAPLP